MAVFIGIYVKADNWFLGEPSTKSKSAFRQGTVFFRLCPGEVSYFCFSFREVFTREARNDLAKPVEVNAFERDRIKAFSHGFPRFTTSHECNACLKSERFLNGRVSEPDLLRWSHHLFL